METARFLGDRWITPDLGGLDQVVFVVRPGWGIRSKTTNDPSEFQGKPLYYKEPGILGLWC